MSFNDPGGKYAIFSRSQTNVNSPVHVYRRDGDALTLTQTYRMNWVSTFSISVLSIKFSPDNLWVLFGNNRPSSSTDQWAICPFDLDTGEIGDPVATGKTPSTVYSVAWSPDGTKFALGHNANSTWSLGVYSFDAETHAVAVVDDIEVRVSGDGQVAAIRWLPDGSGLVAGGGQQVAGAHMLYLVGFDGATLSVADRYGEALAVSDDGFDLSRDGKYLAVSDSGGSTLQVLDISSGSFVEVDSISGWGSNNSNRWSADGRLVFGAESIASFDPGTGTLTGLGIIDVGTDEFWHVAVNDGLTHVFYGRGNVGTGDRVRLASVDAGGSTAAEIVEQVDSDASVDDHVRALTITHGEPVSPLTPEEEFNATYADASGRDPLPTMLVDGPSCQRNINTQVRFWQSVSDPLAVPVFVGLGKLSLVEQGQVIKVHSTRHAIGLEAGRAALVMRTRIDPRSGTCELTVLPNKEDLES